MRDSIPLDDVIPEAGAFDAAEGADTPLRALESPAASRQILRPPGAGDVGRG